MPEIAPPTDNTISTCCYFSIYLPLFYANTMSNYLPLVW